ncbi:MAG: Uma2 family endonuclease [Pirellulaceae bacterium]
MATGFATEIITPEQLAAMPNRKDFELVDGRLVERHMGNKSNWVATQLARLLGNYVEQHRLGWVFTSEAGYRLDINRPNTLRKPDVSFVQFGRLPNEEPADAYDNLAPDWAIEVVSPSDTVLELEEKIDEYLSAGVRLVWVINPERKVVKVHVQNRPTEEYRSGDELTGGDVMPGFRCSTSSLFAMPSPRSHGKS